MLADTKAAEQAGAFSMVLECMSAEMDYADLKSLIGKAVGRYCDEVRGGTSPRAAADFRLAIMDRIPPRRSRGFS